MTVSWAARVLAAIDDDGLDSGMGIISETAEAGPLRGRLAAWMLKRCRCCLDLPKSSTPAHAASEAKAAKDPMVAIYLAAWAVVSHRMLQAAEAAVSMGELESAERLALRSSPMSPPVLRLEKLNQTRSAAFYGAEQEAREAVRRDVEAAIRSYLSPGVAL